MFYSTGTKLHTQRTVGNAVAYCNHCKFTAVKSFMAMPLKVVCCSIVLTDAETDPIKKLWRLPLLWKLERFRATNKNIYCYKKVQLSKTCVNFLLKQLSKQGSFEAMEKILILTKRCAFKKIE